MKVKDLVRLLLLENQELDVVFYNEKLDDNHWGCELNEDDVNNKDLVIYPTIEEED
tara:strand:+ start:458 stop:625 length:168 start_codon:yes stop_codon:yes gene_type:complete